MGAILAGISGPVWGTVNQTNFYIDNISEETSGEETILPDGQGDEVNVAYHGKHGELSMDFSVLNPSSAPAASLWGHTLTIASDTNFAGTYYINQVGRTRQKGQWMTGSVRARRFYASGFTTTTTTTTT